MKRISYICEEQIQLENICRIVYEDSKPRFKMKKAIITGITGQDGAYLAELLLDKGYIVFGTYRRSSSMNFWRIEELGIANNPNLHLLEYDLNDQTSNIRLIEKTQPDEIYNLAAQSFVGVSFEQPIYTAQTTGLGALHILEAIRIVNPKIKSTLDITIL